MLNAFQSFIFICASTVLNNYYCTLVAETSIKEAVPMPQGVQQWMKISWSQASGWD